MKLSSSSKLGSVSSVLHFPSSLSGMLTPERIVLALALVCGVVYLSVVPPWQHYDEPTHFEHAWLIANRLALPEEGDYDQAMRREVAASMVARDFYRDTGGSPNLLQRERPIEIGFSELRHPPFYYMVTAVPLRLIRHADVAFQLYVARGVSLALFLLSMWIATRVVGELTPEGDALRWAVPGMVALLPGYVDLMTAVNNDIGATVVFSLFLWGAVRLIVRGVTVFRVAWVMGAAALCVWTKNTASVAVIVAPLALLLAGVPEAWRRTWAGMLVLGLALVGLTFTWGDAAVWYRKTAQDAGTRQEMDGVPLGAHALALEATEDDPRGEVSQPLLREDVDALRGRTVTLGAWVWATRPITTRSPMIADGRQTTWRPVEVGMEPTFQTVTATVAAGATQIEVKMRPLLDPEVDGEATVYYDGLILTAGEWPFDDTVTFNDPDGRIWSWKGWTFVNVLRNGSVERGWPRVRPRVAGTLRRYARRSPMLFLASVLDWRRTGWVYRPAVLNLLKTFWACFGWGHVSVAPGWYWGVGVMTALGLVSAVVAVGRRWSVRPLSWRRALVCLAAAGLVVWGNALMRPHPFVSDPFMPSARYVLPAIIPTALALMGGWLGFVPRRWRAKVALALLTGLTVLNVVSLTTIWRFYEGG
jgi:hypothetical protein